MSDVEDVCFAPSDRRDKIGYRTPAANCLSKMRFHAQTHVRDQRDAPAKCTPKPTSVKRPSTVPAGSEANALDPRMPCEAEEKTFVRCCFSLPPAGAAWQLASFTVFDARGGEGRNPFGATLGVVIYAFCPDLCGDWGGDVRR